MKLFSSFSFHRVKKLYKRVFFSFFKKNNPLTVFVSGLLLIELLLVNCARGTPNATHQPKAWCEQCDFILGSWH